GGLRRRRFRLVEDGSVLADPVVFDGAASLGGHLRAAGPVPDLALDPTDSPSADVEASGDVLPGLALVEAPGYRLVGAVPEGIVVQRFRKQIEAADPEICLVPGQDRRCLGVFSGEEVTQRQVAAVGVVRPDEIPVKRSVPTGIAGRATRRRLL